MLFNKLIPVDDGEFYTKQIDHSCRFNDDDSAYLSRTPGSAGNLRTFVMFSGWIKRCNLGITCPIVFVDGAANDDILEFNSSDQLTLTLSGTERRRTSQLFRDPTSWFHLYVAIDSTQATAADRITIEVNGVEVTAFGVETDPAQNDQFNFNNTVAHYIGRRATSYADMYLAEIFMIDGTTPAGSIFTAQKYNICIPRSASPTYGTNGAHLDFANAGDLGNDVSGNNNDFASSGLTSNDQVSDSPTNNYCTLSFLNHPASAAILTNGNLNYKYAGTAWTSCLGSMTFPSTGKWYFEYKLGTDLEHTVVGVQKAHEGNSPMTVNTYIGDDLTGWGLWCDGFAGAYKKVYNGSSVVMTGDTPSNGDVIQVAIDMGAGKIWFGSNNTWLSSGDPAAGINEAYSGLTGDLVLGVSLYQTVDAAAYINSGQLGFAHTPPTGFKVPCSENFTDPAIEDCSDGVVVEIDAGVTIASVLAAARSAWGAYIDIFKNLDAGESWDIIFSDDPTNSMHFDTSAQKGAKQSLVAGNSYLGASLRVGATYGCYTAEISHTSGVETNQAHGLGSADVAIAKLANAIGGWWMSHPGLTANYNIRINKTTAEDATEYVEISDTNVTIKSAALTGTYRVIVFKEIEGFSKFGVAKANGNVDGTCVYGGLRPALSLIKDADGEVNWLLFNKDRLSYNVDNNELHPNTNDVEGTTDMVDIVSNGKKIRTTNAEINTNAHNYIFLDWAEQPGKWANAR